MVFKPMFPTFLTTTCDRLCLNRGGFFNEREIKCEVYLVTITRVIMMKDWIKSSVTIIK